MSRTLRVKRPILSNLSKEKEPGKKQQVISVLLGGVKMEESQLSWWD